MTLHQNDPEDQHTGAMNNSIVLSGEQGVPASAHYQTQVQEHNELELVPRLVRLEVLVGM
mgnify:CR=1 FL=1